MSCDTKSTAHCRTDAKSDPHQSTTSSRILEELVLHFDEQTEHHRVYFHVPEEHDGRTFCWSQPLAMIRMDVPVGQYQVTIDTASVRGDRCKFPFELRWNDHRVAQHEIDIEAGKISFVVDELMFVSNDEQRLTIGCRPMSSTVDSRELGMPIASIRLSPTEQTLTVPVSRDQLGQWVKERSLGGFRQLLGKCAPSPLLPIWDMKLTKVSTHLTPESTSETQRSAPTDTVIVTSVEVNSRHGTGLLIQYLFDDLNESTTLCSRRVYNDERVQSYLHHHLPHTKLQRHEIYSHVLEWFRHSPPKRAYVVPLLDSELLMAIAMKDLFGTKICLHFMDDQNLYGSEISDNVMDEALAKADLNFTISPEMRLAYQQRYGHKVYVLPPIVPDNLIAKSALSPNQQDAQAPQRGILIGNVWDHQWLNRLRSTVRESGYQIDWFCNDPNALMDDQQLLTLKDDLEADGIFLKDAIWGDDLIQELKRRPYALLPSGTLDEGELTESIARLSLPSRIPFMTATAQLPVIVLGSDKTAAAQFVDRFQLGRCAAYDGSQFQDAVKEVCTPENQRSIRKAAAELGPRFSAANMKPWVWDSLERGEPVDDRFETLFSIRDDEFAFFIDPKTPKCISWTQQTVWQSLKRLRTIGIQPETIIDVGASTGVWSNSAAKVFPDAHYVMIDPLMSHYADSVKDLHHRDINRYQLIEAALSDQSGDAEFLVSNDLYGSSLLKVDESIRNVDKAKVKVLTLDELADQHDWAGPILLKIDVQYAEHLVIAGGENFIRSNVDALILELSIEREHPDAKTYCEMLDLMDQLGYRLVDEAEGWRTPKNGVLEQKDSVFVRRDLLTQIETRTEGVSSC